MHMRMLMPEAIDLDHNIVMIMAVHISLKTALDIKTVCPSPCTFASPSVYNVDRNRWTCRTEYAAERGKMHHEWIRKTQK